MTLCIKPDALVTLFRSAGLDVLSLQFSKTGAKPWCSIPLTDTEWPISVEEQ